MKESSQAALGPCSGLVAPHWANPGGVGRDGRGGPDGPVGQEH